MDPQLNGMHVAILVTDGFEQVELTDSKQALEQEGAMAVLISERHGELQGFHHDVRADQFSVDLTFEQADPNEFDAVLLPGGHVNAAYLRQLPQAQQFIRDIQTQGKPIAVICHGSWLLVSAGLVNGRTLTSWPSLQEEIRQAGGNWVDREVVVDGNWISSRKPDDIPAFNRAMIDVIAERIRANLRGTADEHAVGIASS